jgi:hypothetical protein
MVLPQVKHRCVEIFWGELLVGSENLQQRRISGLFISDGNVLVEFRPANNWRILVCCVACILDNDRQGGARSFLSSIDPSVSRRQPDYLHSQGSKYLAPRL